MQAVHIRVGDYLAAVKLPALVAKLLYRRKLGNAFFDSVDILIVVSQRIGAEGPLVPGVVLYVRHQLVRQLVGKAVKAPASAVFLVVGVDLLHTGLGDLQIFQLLLQLGKGLRVVGGNGGVVLRRLCPAFVILRFFRGGNGLIHFPADLLPVAPVSGTVDRLSKRDSGRHIGGLLE